MKMNVKVILSSFAIVAVVGGSILSYNHIYADKNEQIEVSEPVTSVDSSTLDNVERDLPVMSDEIQVPVIEGSPFQKISLDTIDIKIPLDLADDSAQSINSSNENEISKLVHVRGVQHNENGANEVIAYYQLADGKHELIISQNENRFGGRKGATESSIANYNVEDVRVEEHEGYTVVIEDADHRKQVHIISDSYYFTVASPGIRDLNLLLDVASKIKVS